MSTSGRAGGAGLVLVAAGGLAREAAAAARAADVAVLGCLDDNQALWGREVAPGLPVLGGLSVATERPDARFLVCAGSGVVREGLVARLDALGVCPERYLTLVHPRASLAPDTVLGAGTLLLAGVVATADVVLEEHVVCMPNVVLTHDDHLESYATVCAGVVLGGNVTIGRAAYVGMAASLREGTTVGARARIGMGAVVLRDVGADETWVGVPAVPLRRPATDALS
ncbi:NeuD/PglB/VioB family sugar acetyltransferase [Terrabacter sp. NPDC080008]|uniref:NeuD/PglB/VioB family sugar acetyltransferase n=1 Tax=Terrabacter sp. NPDC080008 TaxID=3155176 RepID=UPI00345073A9